MKTSIIIVFIWLSIVIAALVGEIKCVIKAVNCNWEPVGRAEVVYTVAALTGFGSIVGYFNIEDK